MRIHNISDRKRLSKHFNEKSKGELINVIIQYVPIELLKQLLGDIKAREKESESNNDNL